MQNISSQKRYIEQRLLLLPSGVAVLQLTLTANRHFAVNLNFYSPLQESDKHDTRTKQSTARSPLHERNRAVRTCVLLDPLEVTVTISSEVET